MQVHKPPKVSHQWRARCHLCFLSYAWKGTGMDCRVGKAKVYLLSCWKVLPWSRTEIWTSPIYFIHYPSDATYSLNLENFHVNLNILQYSVNCTERIGVSLCTWGVFWAPSMNKGIQLWKNPLWVLTLRESYFHTFIWKISPPFFGWKQGRNDSKVLMFDFY